MSAKAVGTTAYLTSSPVARGQSNPDSFSVEAVNEVAELVQRKLTLEHQRSELDRSIEADKRRIVELKAQEYNRILGGIQQVESTITTLIRAVPSLNIDKRCQDIFLGSLNGFSVEIGSIKQRHIQGGSVGPEIADFKTRFGPVYQQISALVKSAQAAAQVSGK